MMASVYRSGGLWREDALSFYESQSYGKRRLWQLVKEQMIERKGMMIRGKRTSKYFMKTKGKRELIKAGIQLPETIQLIEEPKEKRSRKRQWTERDIEILQELYHMRLVKLKHILEKWFRENQSHGYRRMSTMKKEWLVTSERIRRDGKNEAVYRITERGVRLLIERGMLDEKEAVRARDLALSSKQKDVMLDANELRYLANVPYLDSRAFKKKHRINRGEMVLGGFELPDGDCALYIVREHPKNQTIQRLVREIGTAKQRITRYLVLYKSVKNPFESTRWTTGGIPVHVLPLSQLGVAIMRELIFSNRLQKLVQEHGILRKAPDNRWRFRYVLKTPAGDHFAVETLTGDTVLLERALREYRDTRAKVVLFAWEESTWILKQVRSADWITVITIPKSKLTQQKGVNL